MNLPEEMNLPDFSGKFIFWLHKNGEIQEMNLPEEMNLPVFSSKFISSGKFISWDSSAIFLGMDSRFSYKIVGCYGQSFFSGLWISLVLILFSVYSCYVN